MNYLLDVNILISLAWKPHQHHSTAAHWFHDFGSAGWASCALTQAGFIRVITQPAFATADGYLPIMIDQASSMLLNHVSHKSHKFLALNFGFDSVQNVCTGGVQGHRQITDAYLLTLAIQNKRQLVTFDSGIGSLLATAAERQKHLLVLN